MANSIEQTEQMRFGIPPAELSSVEKLKLYNSGQKLYESVYPTSTYYEIDPAIVSQDFGESKYDKRAKYLNDFIDPSELRAREQSGFAKAMAGVAKAGTTTLTTAGNLLGLIVAGTSSGIANVGKEENANGWQEFWHGFIDNPVSRAFMEVEEQIEKAIPNYRSAWEQNTPWYQRVGTANFIFDDIFKNVGFSLGTVAAARALTKGVGKLTRLATRKAYREAFETLGKSVNNKMLGQEAKNVISELGKDLTTLPVEKANAVAKLGKLSRTEDLVTSIYGSATGAIGEAQFEALHAVSDFIDKQEKNYDEWASQNEEALAIMYRNDIQNGKFNSSFEDYKRFKKDEALALINEQARKIGNSVFGFESGLLTMTNFSTFRRFFSNGFRNFNTSMVRTGIVGEGEAVSSRIGHRLLDDGTMEAFDKLTRFGKVMRVAKPVFVEGPIEEMGQNFINKASEYYHGSYLNEQLGIILDQNYNDKAVDWIDSVVEGFARSYGNTEEWIDGFAGSIFGALGIPNIRKRTENEKEGGKKSDYKLSWESGIYGNIKELRDETKIANQTINAVNAFLKSPEQIQKFQTLISQLALDEQMQTAAINRNESKYDDAKHLSLLKTISTFKDSDMLDILEGYIDNASKDLSDESLNVVKQGLDESEIKGKSDDEIRQRIKEESKQIKNIIADYVKVNDDLKFALSNTATQLDINTMGEILSLSQHKMSIAQQLMEKNKEFFKNLSEDATDNDKLAYILNYLEFDTKNFDSYESLPVIAKEEVIDKVYRKFVRKNRATKLTSNALEDRQLWNDLTRITNEIYEGVQLNNEFAVLFENPKLLHEVRKSLFDEHLSEEEKKTVENRVNKFRNAKSIDELEQLYSELKDDDVSSKIIDRLHRIDDSDLIKGFLDYKNEEKAWFDVLNTVYNLTPNKTDDDKIFKDFLKELRKLNYRNGLNRLDQIHSDQTSYSKELSSKINNLYDAFKESINFIKVKKEHEKEKKSATNTSKTEAPKTNTEAAPQPQQNTTSQQPKGNLSNDILNKMFAVDSPLRNDNNSTDYVPGVNFTDKGGDFRLWCQLNQDKGDNFVAYIYANVSKNIVTIKIANKVTKSILEFTLDSNTCNPSGNVKIDLTEEQLNQVSNLFSGDQNILNRLANVLNNPNINTYPLNYLFQNNQKAKEFWDKLTEENNKKSSETVQEKPTEEQPPITEQTTISDKDKEEIKEVVDQKQPEEEKKVEIIQKTQQTEESQKLHHNTYPVLPVTEAQITDGHTKKVDYLNPKSPNYKKDTIIQTFLQSSGTYEFLDSGRLFSEGIYDYRDENKRKIVYFKDLKKTEPDTFKQSIFGNEKVIGIYTKLDNNHEQLIGIVNRVDTKLLNILDRYGVENVKTTVSAFYRNKTRIELVDDPNKPIDFKTIKSTGKTNFFFKTEADVVVSAFNGISKYNQQSLEKILSDDKRLKDGTIYVLVPFADDCAIDEKGNVNYYYSELIQRGIATYLQQHGENNQIVEKYANLLDAIVSITSDNYTEISSLLHNFFVIGGIPYSYTMNIVYNKKTTSYSIKIERSIDGKIESLLGEDNKPIQFDFKQKDLDNNKDELRTNIHNFILKVNPLFRVTPETLNNQNKSNILPNMSELIDNSVFETSLASLTPFNATCVLKLPTESDLQKTPTVEEIEINSNSSTTNNVQNQYNDKVEDTTTPAQDIEDIQKRIKDVRNKAANDLADLLRNLGFDCNKINLGDKVVAKIKVGRQGYKDLSTIKNVSSLTQLKKDIKLNDEQRNQIKSLLEDLNADENTIRCKYNL